MDGNGMKFNFSETYQRELEIIPLINKIEERGLRFDIKKAALNNLLIKREIKVIEDKYGSLNLASPKQVFSHLKSLGAAESELKNSKGKVTTGAKVVERLSQTTSIESLRAFAEDLIELRSLSKVSGTYLGPLTRRAKANDRTIYTTINPAEARTGRMSSSNPNLQNIPETKSRSTGKTNPVRECFIVRDGFANYYFDYVAIELGIFGLYTNDERILQGYRSGEDIHAYMAKIIWRDVYDEDPKYWRGVTKNITYGILFGMGIKKMALTYGMSLADAKRYTRIYIREFRTVYEFQEKCKQEILADGYVTDLFGRRYSLKYGEAYKAVNAIIQGSCAQIFKIALLNVDSYLEDDDDTNILLPVHDEIQIESKVWKNEDEEFILCDDIERKMINIPQLTDLGFDLRVDVKRTMTNWAAKEKLET